MNKKKIDSKSPKEVIPDINADSLPPSRGTTEKLLPVVLILAMTASTGLALYIIVVPDHNEPFTEFYILGPSGEADNYPTSFDPGEQKPVLVGIANHENTYMPYDLVVALNDSIALTTLYEEKIDLDDNETWEIDRQQLKPDRARDRDAAGVPPLHGRQPVRALPGPLPPG